MANAVTTANSGEKVFCGTSDDPFFVDLGGVFDLGDLPRQTNKSVDGVACLNVSTIAIQVPISTLLKVDVAPTPLNILDPNFVIGVWASASRPQIRTLSATGNPSYSGPWVQVSRLAMPLTNEAVIPVGAKDFWNAISPYAELAELTLDEYFYNPELGLYMDDSQFGGAVPAFKPLRIQSKSLQSFDFRNGKNGLFGLKGNVALAGTALRGFVAHFSHWRTQPEALPIGNGQKRQPAGCWQTLHPQLFTQWRRHAALEYGHAGDFSYRPQIQLARHRSSRCFGAYRPGLQHQYEHPKHPEHGRLPQWPSLRR
jgi:Domain of unknown function (DUF4331)